MTARSVPAPLLSAAPAATVVQADLANESFEAPIPQEPLSIATQWATAAPPAPLPSVECEGCMRLTTTPRAPRPPSHAYVFTEVAGSAANLRGGYGGHLVTEQVLLGGGGFGLARHHSLAAAEGTVAGAQRDALGAGGFFGALLPPPDSVVQPIAGVFVGLGNLRYKMDSTEPYPAAAQVFVVAPQLTFEAEVVNLARFGVGASYRAIEGSAIATQLTRDVSGPSVFGFAHFGFR